MGENSDTITFGANKSKAMEIYLYGCSSGKSGQIT